MYVQLYVLKHTHMHKLSKTHISLEKLAGDMLYNPHHFQKDELEHRIGKSTFSSWFMKKSYNYIELESQLVTHVMNCLFLER